MKKIYTAILVVIILILAIFAYQKNRGVKMFFVGDMFFDRTIRKVIYKNGGEYIFSCINKDLQKADLVVGNLEGPITENASVSLLSQVGDENNYTFTFPTQTAKLLAKNNIKVVTLGNNHIGNFGQAGIISTQKYLREAGVEYFGGLKGDEPILEKETNGQRFAFIAYNEFGGESKEQVAEKIKTAKQKGETVVIFAHWGEEYVAPVARVIEAAKLFAESGADLIIGSHPHVVQESEIIGDTPVYYSLGNFIFDQYWNREVSTGLLLEANFKKNKINIIKHQVSIGRDGRTCLVN